MPLKAMANDYFNIGVKGFSTEFNRVSGPRWPHLLLHHSLTRSNIFHVAFVGGADGFWGVSVLKGSVRLPVRHIQVAPPGVNLLTKLSVLMRVQLKTGQTRPVSSLNVPPYRATPENV